MRAVWLITGVVAVALGIGYSLVRSEALNARHKPGRIETATARFAMRAAIPQAAKQLRNPMAKTPERLLEARRLYSDNCAVCHGMHGAGNTKTAEGLSPGVPDLASHAVQDLSDGELFYVIRNGVRFTGMPAWDFSDDQVWDLVGMVRGIPK